MVVEASCGSLRLSFSLRDCVSTCRDDFSSRTAANWGPNTHTQTESGVERQRENQTKWHVTKTREGGDLETNEQTVTHWVIESAELRKRTHFKMQNTAKKKKHIYSWKCRIEKRHSTNAEEKRATLTYPAIDTVQCLQNMLCFSMRVGGNFTCTNINAVSQLVCYVQSGGPLSQWSSC